ncbi:MAG: DUF4091 domain-containing protein [Hyphomicrobiaceae bacterium]
MARSALLLVLTMPGSIVASADNIAGGATVTFSEPPLYALTADSGDAQQLTDGREVEGTMWLSQEAVGWIAGPKPIEIEIDLIKAQPLGSLCLHTSRRSEAGAAFPTRVDIFVGTEPSGFGWAGRLTPFAEAGPGEYLARSFCSPALQLIGRYVRLMIQMRGSFFFTDEITIEPVGAGAHPATSLIPETDLRAFALEQEGVVRSIAELGQSLDGDVTATAQLQELGREVDGPAGTIDRAKLQGLDRQLRQIVRESRAARNETFTAEFCDPWALATAFDGRPLTEAPETLEIAASSHRVVSVAFAHAADRDIDVSVSAFVEGEGADAIAVKLSQVAIVTRADGVRLSDALLPLAGGPLTVPMGETRQLWIDLEAKAPISRALHLTLRIDARAATGEQKTLTRPLLVYSLPVQPKAPLTTVWGYLDSRPIKDHPRAAALDMLAHGVTAAVIPAGYSLPWPQTPDAAIDYRAFDRVMQDLAGHQQVLFFLSLNEGSGFREQLGSDVLSDRWRGALTDWIGKWTARLRRQGYGPDRYAFYPVDEPMTPGDLKMLVAVSRLIKSVDPSLRIYATIHDPKALIPQVVDAVDIFQLNGPALSSETVAHLKNLGKTVASYATSGGGKSGSPETFYRALGWDAFAQGLDGFGFWAYADTGVSGTAWSDIDDVRPDFAVVYDGDREIVSSKRWEAWRDGAEDYTLLTAARDAAADGETRAVITALTRSAQQAGYTETALAPIRKRLRLIAETGHDPSEPISQ